MNRKQMEEYLKSELETIDNLLMLGDEDQALKVLMSIYTEARNTGYQDGMHR